MRHLAPGVTLKDVAGPPARGNEERNRLASLYTPRGWQLRQLGMVFLLVCAMAAIFLPWLAAPVLALVIIWSHELTGGFPARHQPIIGTATERSYVMQVWLAFAIALLATGQGMRSWGARYNKRAERTAAGV